MALSKKTRKVVEGLLQRTRLYKYLGTEPEVIYGHTEDGRRYSDTYEQRKKFVELVNKAVDNLPFFEKWLIIERYLLTDSDYLSDRNVYRDIMNISSTAYATYRKQAFEQLAADLLPVSAGEIE